MDEHTPESPIDAAKYDDARPHLKNAFEHMLAAGRDVRDFGAYALEKFGDAYLPHLRRFLADVGAGRVKVKGLGKAAKSALFGTPVTPEQRNEMVRIAAYLRAERRGFCGGSPEADWLDAEREVDERLALMAGLIARGQQALGTATTIVEKELGNLKDSVAARIAEAGDAKPKPGKKAAARKAEAMPS